MKLNLKTWNALNINDGTNFTAVIPSGGLTQLSASAVTVNRADEYPFLSGRVLPAHTFAIEVYIPAGATINTNRELLKQYFNPLDSQRHNLIAEDTNDSNKQWYLTGYPISIRPNGDRLNGFIIVLAIEVPYWRLVTALTDSWSITASGQTHAVTNSGNIKSKPSFALTPTSSKTGGLSYRRWVSIYNNLDVSYVDALDITSGGLDTATLTTTKLQADGDDLRVYVDGVEVDRWLDAMDTANTKIWVNLSFAPRHEGTTSVSLASATAAVDIQLSRTDANRAFLEYLGRASNKVLLIDNEAFLYTAAGIDLFNYKITAATREAKGTAAAAHTAPKTVRHIEHDIWILYGDSTLTAPDVDDSYKPTFSLASTNASRVYAAFYDTASPRPGAWAGEQISSRTGLSYLYTDDLNSFADPSTELGLALVGTQSIYSVTGETGTLAWMFSHSAGITSVTYSGQRYSYSSSWPEIVGLQHLQPGAVWITDSNLEAPAVALAWEPFGPETVSLSSAPESIRFCIDGSLPPSAGELAIAQFDTITVALSSSNLPTIAVGAEAAAYLLDFVLANSTSGESLSIKAPCKLNDTLTIDCENKLAYLSDGGRASVLFSSAREAWLDLAPGSNTLSFTDTGTNALTLVTTHRDRML